MLGVTNMTPVEVEAWVSMARDRTLGDVLAGEPRHAYKAALAQRVAKIESKREEARRG